MLRAVELFNVALVENKIPFHENVRLRVGSSKAHGDRIRKFIHAKLGEPLSVAMIDRAETPALWTALTRLPDFDFKEGLPEDDSRVIYLHGRKITANERLNFFGTSAACIKVRSGYANLKTSLHHARIYRITGQKTRYAMVRVFEADLLRMTHEDVFTAPLKESAISVRTAGSTIRKALREGTATQIGWLVRGDELLIENLRLEKGEAAVLCAKYPQATSWSVDGFEDNRRLKLRPLLLSTEGIPVDEDPVIVGTIKDSWRASLDQLLSHANVTIVRRNALGEIRTRGSSLPTTTRLS